MIITAADLFFCCKNSFCIPESVLRRVRELLFLCFRKSFPAPGFRGLPPHTPLFIRSGLLLCLTRFSGGCLLFELTLHSGICASQGAGTVVHRLSGELPRTRFSGAAAPIPPPFVRSGFLICLTCFSGGRLLFELTLHSGVCASKGAGTVVHLLSGELPRTRFSGVAAPIPPLSIRSGLLLCLTRFSGGCLLFELTLHSGICASQGAGTVVHMLSGELPRTRFSGAAAPIPPLFVRSGGII